VVVVVVVMPGCMAEFLYIPGWIVSVDESTTISPMHNCGYEYVCMYVCMYLDMHAHATGGVGVLESSLTPPVPVSPLWARQTTANCVLRTVATECLDLT